MNNILIHDRYFIKIKDSYRLFIYTYSFLINSFLWIEFDNVTTIQEGIQYQVDYNQLTYGQLEEGYKYLNDIK